MCMFAVWGKFLGEEGEGDTQQDFGKGGGGGGGLATSTKPWPFSRHNCIPEDPDNDTLLGGTSLYGKNIWSTPSMGQL